MPKLGALTLTKNTGAQHTATVIFFHGSGANAPLQPYTPTGGLLSNVWFDRTDINQDAPEQIDSIKKIELQVKDLIKNENDAGIPSNRIIVGGFSMGGALSLYTGYIWDRNLAGVFAFSSFLNTKSMVYNDLKSLGENKLPPLLQIHGDSDDLVDLSWGQKTFNELRTVGVTGSTLKRPLSDITNEPIHNPTLVEPSTSTAI
ncbi:unnamed protein product, partial [Iphiclides podalirius]